MLLANHRAKLKKSDHLPFIDGMRGIATLFVFLFHALAVSFQYSQLPWHGLYRDFDAARSFLVLYPFSYGWAGVPMFFVISGFCIHLSYKKSESDGWLKFFKRRFFRLYPAYFATIVLFFFLWPWGDSQLSQLVTHVFSVHNYHPKTFYGINASFWSIAVEIQLYALFPILNWISRKYTWKQSMIFVGFIELTIRLMDSVADVFFQSTPPFILKSSPFAFWLSWSIGAYIAQCFLDGRQSKLSSLRLDFAILAAVVFPLFRPTAPFTFLASSLLMGVVLERFLSGRWQVPKFGVAAGIWSHLSKLGLFSYSFYLLHQPILGLTRKLGASEPVFIFKICCLLYIPTLFVSYLFYRFVEQPGIVFGRKFHVTIKKPNDAMPHSVGSQAAPNSFSP